MERRIVDGEIVKLAREQHIPKLHAEIYSFNAQSQRMFSSAPDSTRPATNCTKWNYNFQIEKAPAR